MSLSRTLIAFVALAAALSTTLPTVSATPEVSVSGTTVFVAVDEHLSSQDACLITNVVCSTRLADVSIQASVLARPSLGGLASSRIPVLAATASVDGQVAGTPFTTGSRALVVAPPPPPPGPGPCGVGCVPPWVIALRDWGLDAACGASDMCRSNVPSTPVVGTIQDLVGPFTDVAVLP